MVSRWKSAASVVLASRQIEFYYGEKKKKAEGKKFRSVAISLSPPWGQSKKLGTAKKKNRNDGIKQNNDSSLGINKAEEN